MIFLRILLFPFALLYDGITRLRNHLFNIGHKRSFRFEVPVIGVGNLNVGGSGKTPMIEYVTRLLMNDISVAILSRGYGRVTKGLRFASEQETARTFGDEPLQFFRSFKDKVNVVVGEDRAFAIPHILQEFPQTQVVLMDDAFQHRSVNPHLNILLTEHASPFYSDYVMPFGTLREARAGASRADVIVVTKCPPEISLLEMERMSTAVHKLAPQKPIFFASIKYGNPRSFGNGTLQATEIILVSGIANHKTFEAYAAKNFQVIKHFSFKDHHRYTVADLVRVKEFTAHLGKAVSVLTTEKDMVKLIDPEFKTILQTMSWFYLPIETEFVKDGAEFDKLIRKVIQ